MRILFIMPLCFIIIFLNKTFLSAALNIIENSNKVDSVYNNPSVIVRVGESVRNPIFSWEVRGSAIISSFTVTVSTTNDFTILEWEHADSTSPANTTRFANYDLIKVKYDGPPLQLSTKYYWRVVCYTTASSSHPVDGHFLTSSAAVTLESQKAADMKIDFNNPLKPGKKTKIRVAAFDRDRDFKLRIFSISGELIIDWQKFTVYKDSYYTIEWDGRDYLGNSVERGIYIVNLYDETDNLTINRRLAVVK